MDACCSCIGRRWKEAAVSLAPRSRMPRKEYAKVIFTNGQLQGAPIHDIPASHTEHERGRAAAGGGGGAGVSAGLIAAGEKAAAAGGAFMCTRLDVCMQFCL